MSQHLINIHSNVGEKKPTSSQIEFGEIAINYNSASPKIFIKNSDNNIAEFIDKVGVETAITSRIVTEISSGATDTQVPSAKAVYNTITENERVTAAAINDLNTNKQDKITDLDTIRSNASAGKTASDNLGGHTVGINVPSNAKFTDTTYGVATTSANGLMSSTDKSKLDGIATGATKVVESTVSDWGFTKNTGTVTSVAVKMNGTTAGTVTTTGTIDLGSTLTLDSTQTLTENEKDNVLRKLDIADERLNLTIECDTPSAVVGVTVIVAYGNIDHSYTYQGPMSITIPAGQNYIIKFSHISGYYAPDSITYESIRNNVRNVTVSYRTTLYSDLSLKDINGLDLLKRNTANCYVIKSTGYYEFPLVYGNAITNGETNASAYTRIEGEYTQPFYNYLNRQITSPFIEIDTNTQAVSANIAYSDVPTSSFEISGVKLVQRNLCKYLRFDVNKFPSDGGNAVLCVKDGGGQIMWSWHIWAYGDALTEITHTNNSGKQYKMLNVNLGWVKEGEKYGTCPFYQWGRKDPMLRAASSNSNTNASLGYGSWGVTSTALSVASTIQNPGTFNTYETTHYNWWTNNGTVVDFYNYWDASQTTTGNADKTVIKTVYDPCPAGFSIPCGNAFLEFSTGNGGTWDKGYVWDGRYFPAAGCRYYGSGGLYSVSGEGSYWLASSLSQDYAYYLLFNSGSVYPQNGSRRAYGFSVCPVRLLELI